MPQDLGQSRLSLFRHFDCKPLKCFGHVLDLVLLLQVLGYFLEEFILRVSFEVTTTGCSGIHSFEFDRHRFLLPVLDRF